MRAPRSPSPWELRLNPSRRSRSKKNGSPTPGAHHSSTGPSRASAAARRLCITSRRCSAAASASPSAGISRVLTLPGSGALAKTMTRQPSLSAFAVIVAGKTRGRRAEEKFKPQPPHQEHGAQHPAPLPSPSRRDDFLGDAQRPRDALERARQRNVLHQIEGRKTPGPLERAAADEDRLVAGRDAGRA